MRKLASPMIRTLVLLVIAASLLVFTGAGCERTSTKGGETSQQKSKEKEEESKVLRTDVSKKLAIVAAAAKIDELRKAGNPNYTEIENIFNSELKETVAKRDAENGIILVADIEKAIAAAKAGAEVTLNGQRISKTLIRAFYLSVKHEFEEAESLFADKTEKGAFNKWDEAEAYFGGLKIMGYFKNNPDLLTKVEEAFEDGREAIAEDELLEMKLNAQIVDKTSIRAFVGSVLGEADEAKGAEAVKALEKIVEAQVFYSAIADKFEAYGQQIGTALASPGAANPDTLRSLFGQGLADKVIGETEEVISNWGTDKAAVVAREADLYMETLEIVIAGKQVGDIGTIKNKLSQLEGAVAASDKGEAGTLVGEITEAVKNVKSNI